MSDLLSILDELKNKCIDHSTDVSILIAMRSRLDELEESTIDTINTSLITVLKIRILK